MQTLDVVNLMLGSMGESPLASIEEPHAFRGAALNMLDQYNKRIQSKGAWYNTENLRLEVSAADSCIYVPGDALNVRAPTRNVQKRGRRLYDLDAGTYNFTAPLDCVVIRLLPFEDLPEIAAAYISAAAILRFQSSYDGDTAKTRELSMDMSGAFTTYQGENTRQSRTNMIDSHPRLALMKARTRMIPRY
jgi:hypothetical protein